MERLKCIGSLLKSPHGMMWALAYLVLLGCKPWLLNKFQELLGCVPVYVLFGAFVVASVYFLLLPKKLHKEYKDLWDGNDCRDKGRKALDELKEAIVREAHLTSREKLSVVLRSYCIATILFHSASYEQCERIACAAQLSLGTGQGGN